MTQPHRYSLPQGGASVLIEPQIRCPEGSALAQLDQAEIGPAREGGETIVVARPMTDLAEIAPKKRESAESARLSPSTK